jgi:hypothetical protein
VTVVASNSAGSDEQSFTIEVAAATTAPSITSAPVTVATVGQPYSYAVTASGSPAPSYNLSSAPVGMTIDATTGVIAWTPDTAGSYAVTVVATNSAGSAEQSFSIEASEATTAPVITSAPVTAAMVGQNYSYAVTASGSPFPTFGLTVAPTGMTIDNGTGLISWTPDAPGSYAVTVVASNSSGSAEQSFTLEVVEVTACSASQTAYWPFNEPAGSTLFTDVVGSHNGSCTGGACPAAATGQVGGALAFDGGDGIDVTEVSDFNWSGSESFALALWVNTMQSCSGNKVFLGKYKSSGTNASWWLGCEASGNALFSLRDSGGTTAVVKSTAPVNDGQWHHLVAVRDGVAGANLLYLDGALQGATTKSYGGNFASTSNLNIGYYVNGYRLSGLLDEVAIYHTALTASDVQQHYSDGLSGTPYCTVPSAASTDSGTGNREEGASKLFLPITVNRVAKDDTEEERQNAVKNVEQIHQLFLPVISR